MNSHSVPSLQEPALARHGEDPRQVRRAGRGAALRSPLAAAWLFAIALMVLGMVVVGGTTRLTGSGLSITRWRPIAGALPPLSAQAWRRDFALYQATPQYRRINRGMSLGSFKFIFWWEWSHRLLGRAIGAAFLLPFLVLLALRAIPKRLIWLCAGLFALGGLQGLVGWWMVESGLEARVSVAPERLAAHLGLALILYSSLILAGLEALAGQGRSRRRDGWSLAAVLLAFGIFAQCLLGALLAGNHGGLVDNDWPLMDGKFFPSDYWRGSFWSSFAHGPAASQFDHRSGAYLLFAAAFTFLLAAWRSQTASPVIRRGALAVFVAILVQASLGIATLRLIDPLSLAILHQACAALVLAVGVVTAWVIRRDGIIIPKDKSLENKALCSNA
ncbi:MAG: COX15/CtaA family protein [Caulobacteraceae bacterium]